MTSREVPHLIEVDQLGVPAAVVAGGGVALDTSKPFLGVGQSAAAAAILINVGAWTVGSITPTLEESDSLATGYAAVDPFFQEWFQESISGGVTGGLWVPSTPGSGVTPVINSAALSSHVYMVSYVGGLKRFLRINFALASSPTNIVAVMGLLFGLEESYGKAYTNYDYSPIVIS